VAVAVAVAVCMPQQHVNPSRGAAPT